MAEPTIRRKTSWKAICAVPALIAVLATTSHFVKSYREAHRTEAVRGGPSVALGSVPPQEELGTPTHAELDVKPSPADRPLPYRTAEARIPNRSTASRTLQGLGLSAKDVALVSEASKPVKDIARIAAGTLVTATWQAEGDLLPRMIELRLSETKILVLERDAASADAGAGNKSEAWRASMKEEVVVRRAASYAGVVNTNLWASATAAGMDPTVISKLTEIFAWQIDFNREVHLDDRWRLTVEQLFVNGRAIGFGEIIAAEYENVGILHSAIRYNLEAGGEQYFQPDGTSLRRMFLRSPLAFGRITSGFTAARFHPILKVTRPHNGTDYGASPGTPIMAVGGGTVTFAGPRGPSGNMVNIRHNSVYETNYKHMQSFAAGVRVGSAVEMGQVIGYVGQTGLATGPHLHFEFHENGQYVDSQGINFPAADPVPAEEAASFREVARAALSELPTWAKPLMMTKQIDLDQEPKISAK